MVLAHLTLPRTPRCELEEGEEALPHPSIGGRRVPALGLLCQHSTCIQDRLEPSQALLQCQHSYSYGISV